ncbi:hypothetical protein ES703_67096 [subsurface metagenome]
MMDNKKDAKPRPNEKRGRNDLIKQGRALNPWIPDTELGRIFGITKQRVGQILKKRS